MSVASSSTCCSICSILANTFECDSTTPLGFPSVPDVNKTTALSSGEGLGEKMNGKMGPNTALNLLKMLNSL